MIPMRDKWWHVFGGFLNAGPKFLSQKNNMTWHQWCCLFLKICSGPTKVAVLENVLGFLSVLDKVCKFIERNCPGFLT